MADSVAIWDRRNEEHRNRFAVLLTPLITASRTKDFEGTDRARVQLHTWMLSLADVPEAVLTAAVARLVRRGVTWMPKPGELKAVCAEVLTELRAEAAKRHLADCPHSSHWTEDERGRMVRCPCWKRAMDASREIGAIQAPMALPAAVED